MNSPRLAPLAVPTLALGFALAAGAQLTTTDPQFWHQSSAGIDLPAQGDALFASALAAGDFDGDGFEDLAVGIPEYDLDEMFDVGMVLVMYGSANGPTTVGKDLWTQGHVLLIDEGEEDDRFGEVLATGDFDADGFDDLAIGVPNEGIGAVASAGAVQVLFGSVTGLSTVDQFFYQGNGIADSPQQLDRFGSTLAVGDFDADGHDDLAIGTPYEQIGATANAGAVHVLFGDGAGLSLIGDRFFAIGTILPGNPITSEFLGWSLAAGDFDPDTPGDELAIGAPGATANGFLSAGAVWFVASVEAGSTSFRVDLDSAGMPGDAAFGDQLGCALAAGQFDGVGRIDLAMTACRRVVSGMDDAGAIFVDYGLVRPVGQFDQNDMDGEQADDGDFFGSVLAAGDVDADGVDELAIGVEFETIDGDTYAGTAHLVPGVAGAGLAVAGAIHLEQVMSPSEAGDHFGAAIVAGRFRTQSGGSDLAVGASLETYAGDVGAGALHVYRSTTLLLDDFETGLLLRWSHVVGAF
jgi:hypothetical protein